MTRNQKIHKMSAAMFKLAAERQGNTVYDMPTLEHVPQHYRDLAEAALNALEGK